MTSPLWQPSARSIERSNLARFAQANGFGQGARAPSPDDLCERYQRLHAWSVDHRDEFWQAVWDFCDVRASVQADQVMQDGDAFPGTAWFPGARLNFAENLLRHDGDGIAIIAAREDGGRTTLTHRELRERVAGLAKTLGEIGVAPGVRVAGWLPNVAETVIAMLATASLGGVWSSCSPDFGSGGAIDRFGQIEPKVMIACDGYSYGGKTFDIRDRVGAVCDAVPSIEHVLWVSVLGLATDDIARSFERHPNAGLEYAGLPFDHPLYIMYSSGTTGKPKCIVHGAGGTLLQHLKEHVLHVDLKARDTLFFFTTCGWMMWNWLVSGLATGATLVLYDGSPFHPNAYALMDLMDETRITVFGAGAKYFASLDKAGVRLGEGPKGRPKERPKERIDTSSLRCILSTGSPLTHEGFRYIYGALKGDLHLASISGGTDILSCFVLGVPWLPVYAGELQRPGLGMDVDVVDENGASLIGEKGELICRRSFPSAPLGFWNDPDDEKYRAAYFDKVPGAWAHGDFAEFTEHGGMIIHGRSDAVLNPGGVRIGTAEIYRQVEAMDEVVDAVAVGQAWQGDTRIVLFVVLRDGAKLSGALRRRIEQRIRERASPRHVPSVIVQVPDVPRTRSGKVAELAVRSVIHGEPISNATALANPEVLSAFENLPELG